MGFYKIILIIARPLIYSLVAFLIYKFGNKFIKNSTFLIGVFLLTLSGLCIVVLGDGLIAGFVSHDSEELMQSIVGFIMLGFFILIGMGYLLASFKFVSSDKEQKEGTNNPDKKPSRIGKIIYIGLFLSPSLAFFFFSIPLYLIDNVAAIVIAAIIQCLSLIAFIFGILKIVKDFTSQK